MNIIKLKKKITIKKSLHQKVWNSFLDIDTITKQWMTARIILYTHLI